MEIKTALAAFSALSQETRLEIFQHLVRFGPEGRQAGEIGQDMAVAPSTLSFHLKELEQAGLVTSDRQGRHIVYRADYAGIRDLIDFIMADCCQGDPRLCGPYIIKEKCNDPAQPLV